MITLVLIVVTVICFVLAAIGVGGRVNLVAAGLAVLTFALYLLPHIS